MGQTYGIKYCDAYNRDRLGHYRICPSWYLDGEIYKKGVECYRNTPKGATKMKRTPLLRKTPLKAHKRLRMTSDKTAARNAKWRAICIDRAIYLSVKYGFIICEYSGEVITTLSSVPNDTEEGWGHHIDGNRNNTNFLNCMIVKYRYHQLIHDKNIKVEQEWFIRNVKDNKVSY